jgi:uncharacterized protein YfaA (DUF2138 family)
MAILPTSTQQTTQEQNWHRKSDCRWGQANSNLAIQLFTEIRMSASTEESAMS